MQHFDLIDGTATVEPPKQMWCSDGLSAKAVYASERSAKRALSQCRHAYGGRLRPYRCGSHWHLGSREA